MQQPVCNCLLKMLSNSKRTSITWNRIPHGIKVYHIRVDLKEHDKHPCNRHSSFVFPKKWHNLPTEHGLLLIIRKFEYQPEQRTYKDRTKHH